MTKFYIIRDGERLYADTERGVRKLAQLVADQLGQGIRVYKAAAKGKPGRPMLSGAKPKKSPARSSNKKSAHRRG